MLSKDYSAEFKQRFADGYNDGVTITMMQYEFSLTKSTARLWRKRIDQGGTKKRLDGSSPVEYRLGRAA